MFDPLKKMFGKDAFGLYITDTFLQAVTFDEKTGKQIKLSGQRPLPKGVVQNGLIKKEQELANEVKTLLTATKIESSKCYLTVPDDQFYEHIFYLPAELKGEELVKELERQISNTIPVPLHELKYDFHTTTHTKVQVVYVIAVSRVVIAQYYETLKKLANVEPVSLEPASLSLVRNIPLNLKDDKGAAVIRVTEGKTSWSIIWQQDVFDSNKVTNIKELAADLDKGTKRFSETTKRNVAGVIIIGTQQEVAAINEAVKGLKIPVQQLKQFRIQNEEFKICAGALLKNTNPNLTPDIDLLRK